MARAQININEIDLNINNLTNKKNPIFFFLSTSFQNNLFKLISIQTIQDENYNYI